jgi:hypothetical protein
MGKMLDLESIKARLAAATPGPWQWFGSQGEVGTFGMLSTKGSAMLQIKQANQFPIDAEMCLIEHAPADMTALVAEVERLRAAMDEEDDLHDAIKQQCFGLDEAAADEG